MVPPLSGWSPGGGRPGLTIQTNPTMSADNADETDETDDGEEYIAVADTHPPTDSEFQRVGMEVETAHACPAYTATGGEFVPGSDECPPLLRLESPPTAVFIRSEHRDDEPIATTVWQAYDYIGAKHPEAVLVSDYKKVLPTHVAREIWFEAIRQFEAQVDTVTDYHACANARKMAKELGWGWRESDEPDCATVQQQSDDE